MSPKKKPAHLGRTITARIRTSADPERLWDAWADPARLAEWFPDRAEGRAVEGGVQTWYFDRFKYTLPYDVHSAVPAEHLVFTGEPPGRPRFFLEIEIVRDAGSTVLTLTNSGFLDQEGWDEEYEGIASGWQMALAMLKLYVERYFGRPRTQFFAMRPAQYEYGDLLPFYREPDRLRTWLTSDGRIGEAGEPYAIVLMDGVRASGLVLAVTGWEVQLSWDEIDGCMALKGFGLGQGRRAVCIHGSGWGLAPERAAELEQRFDSAVERLSVVLKSSVTSI